jgi:hypothetical protein
MTALRSEDRFQSLEEIEVEIFKLFNPSFNFIKDDRIIDKTFTIEFTTSIFDISKEEKRPYNETAYGQSVLLWLTKQLPSNIKIEDMDMEDWGWYSYIKCENEKYRVGANIFDYGNSKDKFSRVELRF